MGKHTDKLIEELVVTTEGKTDCKQWNSDDWGAMNEFYLLKSWITLARITANDWNELMELLDNRPDDGTDDKISLVRCGSKRK